MERANYDIDYIITHSAPNSIVEEIGKGGYVYDPLTDFLEEIKNRANFYYWLFGRYHQNQNIADRYVLLWEQIIQIL